MTQPNVPEPNGYEEAVAELRRIASVLEALPPGFEPGHIGMNIMAGPKNDASAVAAVDAVGMALLGRSGTTEPMTGGSFHHRLSGEWSDPVRIAIFQAVPAPAKDSIESGAVVNGGEVVGKAAAEAATLNARIHFAGARREAGRLTGRTTSERLRAATLDLLHGQALDEDAARTQRADLRDGEQGRITNPNLAHFLAIKEERRRIAQHFLGLEESAKHYPAKPVSESR